MPKKTDSTIHMIGHGHIDPTWLWRWREGYEEVRATFRSALDRMDETPGFTFTASSACFYQWIRESEPALFERIQARVREGRWEIVGGMWVEPDCNVPCGESFVRHGLYSQQFFEEVFGKRATIGFNPDSFGHCGALPQILAKLGMDAYVYLRPQPATEMDYPDGGTFWWEAADGSRVLACNIPIDYVASDDLPERLRALPEYPHLNRGQTQLLGFYGVGNHGGGPTKAAIQCILDAAREDSLPEVRFSTLRAFVDAFLETTPPEAVPTMRRELQHHARGCYSAHAELKRLNRRTEHELLQAERFATAAWLLDAQPYPAGQLELAWKDLLYNQFHDILAGTSIASSYQQTRDQLGAARHRAETIANRALQSMARDIDTTAEGNTIVIINPVTWDVRQPVEVSSVVARGISGPLHLVDDEENPVPIQAVRGEVHARRGEVAGRTSYAFAAEAPAMGYRVYHVRGAAPDCGCTRRLQAEPTVLENDWWRIEFDPDTGQMTRLYDRMRRVDVLERGNVLSVLLDPSDTWSHDVDGYRVEEGRFGDARLRIVEDGPVLSTLRAESRFNRSTAISEVTLYRNLDMIDCRFRINWQEAHRVLKLAYETRVRDGEATFETPYGFEVRPLSGDEEPGQQWADLTGVVDRLPYGLAVLTDGQYGYDANGGRLRATLLRSPAYAHHDPIPLDAGSGARIMDQGWHDAHMRLVPHAGPWEEARIVKRAWELNVPLVPHVESAHPGRRPGQAQLMGTEAGNVLLSVVKCGEDGKALIIRGYETCGAPARTTLHLPFADQSFELAFAPHEIKTIRIDPATWRMEEVNLLEE